MTDIPAPEKQHCPLTRVKSTLGNIAAKITPDAAQRQWISRHWHILDGSCIKLLAIILMTVDHTAGLLFWHNPSFHTPLLTHGTHPITAYALMRPLGRLAGPICAFLHVEGYRHTHNRVKYGRNLFLFALISEIPWNIAHSGTLLYPVQNVFFTLFLGYLGICALEHFKKRPTRMAVSLISLLVVSILLRADYGCIGYGFILALYALRNNTVLQAVVGCCILPSRWIAGLAFIPLSMYNGKRGFVKGLFAKYFFYVYYPLHLLVIYLIRTL